MTKLPSPITLQTTADHTWISVPTHLLPVFRQMVNRACNCWPDAPPEIKQFADLITPGQIYQDYTLQNTDQKQRPNNLSWELGELPDHLRSGLTD